MKFVGVNGCAQLTRVRPRSEQHASPPSVRQKPSNGTPRAGRGRWAAMRSQCRPTVFVLLPYATVRTQTPWARTHLVNSSLFLAPLSNSKQHPYKEAEMLMGSDSAKARKGPRRLWALYSFQLFHHVRQGYVSHVKPSDDLQHGHNVVRQGFAAVYGLARTRCTAQSAHGTTHKCDLGQE